MERPMNQTVRNLPSPIQWDPLAHPIAIRNTCVVEAVRYLPQEDDPRAILGENWIIRERDTAKNILRESTDLYSSGESALDAYWWNEVTWEAWVSPLFATGEAA
jgi:hypothetical protein